MFTYMHDGDGWNALWMIPMMLLWIAVIGAVVYFAVRTALPDRKPQSAISAGGRRPRRHDRQS